MSATVGAPAGAPDAATTALPVRVALTGADSPRVLAWIESTLGWQPVDDATAALVPPALTLVDAGWCADRPVRGPVVMVVAATDAPAVAAAAATRLRPDAVVTWPAERDRLGRVAAAVVARRPIVADPRVLQLRVGGASGGVGTTTIALAIGGVAAWSGGDALVVAAGSVPAPAGRVLPADAVASVGTWELATRVPGVPGLRLVRTDAPVGDRVVNPGGASVVVRDVGIGDDADVLVLRRDAGGLAALRRTVAAAAVVVDHGPAAAAAIRRAAGERRVVVAPYSARVAQAALGGRVPAGLPGAWLRRLRPVLPHTQGRSDSAV